MIDFEKETISGNNDFKSVKTAEEGIAIDRRAAGIRKAALIRRAAGSMLLILLGVTIFVNRQSINLYSLRKLMNSFSTIAIGEKSAQLSKITYDNIDKNRFAVYKNNIAVLSEKELTIYDTAGDQLFNTKLSLASPSMVATKKYILIYDRESNRVIVHNGYMALYDKYVDGELLMASMNDSGYFAIVTKDKYYSAIVRVYNSHCAEIYDCHFGEKYISSVSISNDNRLLAVAGFDGKGGDIVSSVQVYKLSEEKAIAEMTGIDGLIFSVAFKRGGTLAFLTEKALYSSSDYKNMDTVYDCEGKYILYFDSANTGYTALLTSRQLTGGDCTATLLDSSGKKIFAEDAGVNVRDMTFNGKELSLLSDQSMVSFDLHGNKSSTVSMPIEAKKLLSTQSGEIVIFELNKASLLK